MQALIPSTESRLAQRTFMIERFDFLQDTSKRLDIFPGLALNMKKYYTNIHNKFAFFSCKQITFDVR